MKVGLVITAYERPDELNRTLKSLSQSQFPTDFEIYIIDDFSKSLETQKIIQSFNIPGVKITKVRNDKNQGMYYGLKKGFDYFYDNDFDVLSNLDPDALVKPYWIKILLQLNRLYTDHIISGFNCPSHPIVEGFRKHYTKRDIGGINLLFNRNVYPGIKPHLHSNNWDWDVSYEMQRQKKLFIITRPSVLQHIAEKSIMGHDNNPDVALDWSHSHLPPVEEKRILVAGPFVGELGFELGNWAPHILYESIRGQEEVHVFTRPGRECLYPFAKKFILKDFPNTNADCNWLWSPGNNIQKDITNHDIWIKELEKYAQNLKSENIVRTLISNHSINGVLYDNTVKSKITYTGIKKEYWDNVLPKTKRIILTFRGYHRGARKNSDVDFYNRIIDWLKNKGYSGIVVGSDEGKYSKNIKGISFINQTNLDDLISIYRVSDLAVGFTTGIIHLASACCLPHVSWGGDLRFFNAMNLNNTWYKLLTTAEQNVDFTLLCDAIEEGLLLSNRLES